MGVDTVSHSRSVRHAGRMEPVWIGRHGESCTSRSYSGDGVATERGECDDCGETLTWAGYIARIVEIGKGLSDVERARFQRELEAGDALARTLAGEIRLFKSGRWGTQAMHDRAVARLKEHEEWKRLWK